MPKMNAVIIFKTDECIDCDKTNIREQIEDLFDDPNIFQMKEFNDDNSMFELIHKALGKPTVGVTASNIWENKDTIFAGYFIDLIETIDLDSLKDDDEEKMSKKIKEAQKKIQLNVFGSQITSHSVTGNLVIIKKNLSYTTSGNNIKTNTTSSTISPTELLDVLENIFIKEGVVINADGSMSTYKYIMNPVEHLMLTDSNYTENCVCHEYEVYTHVMIVTADTRQINGELNKIATLLTGKPVNGTVFVAMYKKPDYNENPPYVGLSIERLKKILAIRQKSASLTTGMAISEKEYANFDNILELEIEKHSDKPNLLVNEITGELLNKK